MNRRTSIETLRRLRTTTPTVDGLGAVLNARPGESVLLPPQGVALVRKELGRDGRNRISPSPEMRGEPARPQQLSVDELLSGVAWWPQVVCTELARRYRCVVQGTGFDSEAAHIDPRPYTEAAAASYGCTPEELYERWARERGPRPCAVGDWYVYMAGTSPHGDRGELFCVDYVEKIAGEWLVELTSPRGYRPAVNDTFLREAFRPCAAPASREAWTSRRTIGDSLPCEVDADIPDA